MTWDICEVGRGGMCFACRRKGNTFKKQFDCDCFKNSTNCLYNPPFKGKDVLSLAVECMIDFVNRIWQKLWCVLLCMRSDNEKIAVAIWHGRSHFQFLCSVGSQSLAISSLRQPMESKCHMVKSKSLANSLQSIRACEPCERAWKCILSELNLQVRSQFLLFHEGPWGKTTYLCHFCIPNLWEKN